MYTESVDILKCIDIRGRNTTAYTSILATITERNRLYVLEVRTHHVTPISSCVEVYHTDVQCIRVSVCFAIASEPIPNCNCTQHCFRKVTVSLLWAGPTSSYNIVLFEHLLQTKLTL